LSKEDIVLFFKQFLVFVICFTLTGQVFGQQSIILFEVHKNLKGNVTVIAPPQKVASNPDEARRNNDEFRYTLLQTINRKCPPSFTSGCLYESIESTATKLDYKVVSSKISSRIESGSEWQPMPKKK
jgi:hypothetical protein